MSSESARGTISIETDMIVSEEANLVRDTTMEEWSTNTRFYIRISGFVKPSNAEQKTYRDDKAIVTRPLWAERLNLDLT